MMYPISDDAKNAIMNLELSIRHSGSIHNRRRIWIWLRKGTRQSNSCLISFIPLVWSSEWIDVYCKLYLVLLQIILPICLENLIVLRQWISD